MALTPGGTTLLAELAVLAVAIASYRRRKLTAGGSVSGFVVGSVLNFKCQPLLVATVVFFVLSTVATKYRSAEKRRLLAEDTCRKSTQVWANAGAAVVSSVLCSRERGVCWAGLAAVASAFADTLSSELGMVIAGPPPRLITKPWKRLKPGANGGVTLTGFAISFIGGCLAGLAYAVCAVQRESAVSVTLKSGLLGLTGSAIDSVLGALLEGNRDRYGRQVDGFGIISNDLVNLAATSFTAVLAHQFF